MAQEIKKDLQVSTQKVQHTWQLDSVSKKDLNMNQWPFKVVRDKGRPTKMEARSITDLNKSFDGTIYNLNDCPKVKSRYTLLFDVLRNRYIQHIPKITHLMITFDSVYFLTSDDSNIRGGIYANDILKSDDLNGLMTGLLYRTGYLEGNIKTAFQAYKQSQGAEEYRNLLVKEVQTYINMRKKMRVIDTTKPLIDVLKSELNFTSLQYLIFVPYPNMAKDYQNTVIEGFMRNNIAVNNNSELVGEIKKLPTLNGEIGGLQNFIGSLEKKEFHRTIRKVYMLKPNEPLSVESIKKLFLNVTNSAFMNGLQYISDAEKARIEAKHNEIEKKTSDEKTALAKSEPMQKQIEAMQKIESEIFYDFNYCLRSIVSMVSLITELNKIYIEGKTQNNIEFDIWIKYFSPSLIKKHIESVYHYRNKRIGEDIKEKGDLPVNHILMEVAKHAPSSVLKDVLDNDNPAIVNSLLNLFTELVVPEYFKNDIHTFKSIGCSFDTKEGLEKVKEVTHKIKLELFTLFESTLGVILATFGMFMKRYGVNGVGITKVLVQNIVDNYSEGEFFITENIKQCANEAFYMLYNNITHLLGYGVNADSKDKESISEEKEDGASLGLFNGFVMKYLNELFNVKQLEHSSISKAQESEDKRYLNMGEVHECVFDIINQCKELLYLDITREDILKLLVKSFE